MLFEGNPAPRYAQLAELLRQRISRGRLRAGDRLPSMEELAREFDIARVTVRQAFKLLAREGLVSLRQGRGTYVTAAPATKGRLRVETTLRELAEMYRTDRPEILNVVESNALPDLAHGEGTRAERYFYMRRVHYRDSIPYGVISIYLEEGVFKREPERFRNQLVIPILVSLPGLTIARARQTLTISSADVEIAKHLRIPVNSPVADIRRVFHGVGGEVIYVGEATVRGDFVHLEMDLKP
jgi:GntR family transcriptional regulator